MTAELVLSVFVLLVLAFVGGHQLAVHRMTKHTHQAAKLRVGGTLDDACRFADHFTLVGKEMVCDHRGGMLYCAGNDCERCPFRYKGRPMPFVDPVEEARDAKERMRAGLLPAFGEKPPRDTGHLGTPMDRIPLRKPSRGNGHETPYARKKRAAKPKGKA